MLLCVSVAQAQENQTDTCAVNVSDSTEVEERPRWLHLKTNVVGLELLQGDHQVPYSCHYAGVPLLDFGE